MEKIEKFDGRGKSRNPRKLRNLPQYRDLDDEAFQRAMSELDFKERGVETVSDLEKKIKQKLELFENDYDLSDMKINDREVLRGLIQSIISLEEMEQESYKLRAEGVNPSNILAIEKLNGVMSGLRKDISNMQNDLSITRKHRKSDQETSVLAYIDNIREKARKFVEARSLYVMCPKCNTLLATTWFLFPNDHNEIIVTCKQKDRDGNPCNNKFKVTSKEMLEKRGTNLPDVLPDSMK